MQNIPIHRMAANYLSYERTCLFSGSFKARLCWNNRTKLYGAPLCRNACTKKCQLQNSTYLCKRGMTKSKLKWTDSCRGCIEVIYSGIQVPKTGSDGSVQSTYLWHGVVKPRSTITWTNQQTHLYYQKKKKKSIAILHSVEKKSQTIF